MKLKLFLVLIAAIWTIAVARPASAQVPEAQVFHGISGLDFNILPDGGGVIAGTLLGEADRDFKYAHWLLRVDEQGHTIWERSYGAEDWLDRVRVAALSDGGFALLGKKTPEGAEPADTQTWLLRTDGDGNTLWEQTIPRLGHYDVFVAPTVEGGVFVFGNVREPKEHEVLILRLDREGAIVRESRISGAGEFRVEAVAAGARGGHILAGSDWTSERGRRIWLAGLDRDSNVLWRTEFSAGSTARLSGLTSLSDGGFALLVRLNANEFFITRRDGTGERLWRRAYRSYTKEFARGLVALPDGSLVALARADDLDVPGRGMRLRRFNASGDVVWTHDFGTRDPERAYAIRTLPTGGFAVLGDTSCEALGVVWLLRYPQDLPENRKHMQPRGIGVARPCIQWTYENAPAFQITFGQASPVNGQPRFIGGSIKRLHVELVGPLTDLVSAKFNVPIDPSHPVAYPLMGLFLMTATPWWQGRWKWLQDKLPTLSDGQEIRHELDGRLIVLRYYLSLLEIEVSAPGAR